MTDTPVRRPTTDSTRSVLTAFPERPESVANRVLLYLRILVVIPPRDQIAHVKLMRRNLYTAVRDSASDSKCLCCGEPERQQHLAECRVMRAEFWGPLIDLMRTIGWQPPDT
jgi:hypothetical protein